MGCERLKLGSCIFQYQGGTEHALYIKNDYLNMVNATFTKMITFTKAINT